LRQKKTPEIRTTWSVSGQIFKSARQFDFTQGILREYTVSQKVYFRVFTSFLLSLFVLLSSYSVEGSVLCFGEDGHVAIEFIDDCNEAGPGSQLAGMERDDCGPCRDIRFLSSPACTRNTSHYAQTLPQMSLSAMSPSLPLKEHPGRHINLTEHSYHKTLAGLHSVVLLI
jgi:hypothetical protein